MTTELSRAQWNFGGRLGPKMTLPVRKVFIHHTVTRRTSDWRRDALTVVDIGVQRFGRGSYNWLLHDDGDEARSLELQGTHRGVHTSGHNTTAISLCAIGDYHTRSQPSDHLLQGFVDTTKTLIRTGVVDPSYSMRSHSDVKATACAGQHLRKHIPDIHAAVRAGAELPKSDPVLHGKGSTGPYVALLQGWMETLGFPVGQHGADGKYGGDTAAAVAQFQKANGLEATGVYTQSTADKLQSVIKQRGLKIPSRKPLAQRPSPPVTGAVDLDRMGLFLAAGLQGWAETPERGLAAELAAKMEEYLASGNGRIG